MSQPLDDESRANVLAHIRAKRATTSEFRLAFKPRTGNSFLDSVIGGRAGPYQHVELQLDPDIAPVAFSAVAGRWPDPPPGRWRIRRLWDELSGIFRRPPIGPIGVYLQGRTFSDPSYEYFSFPVNVDDELALWTLCNEMHGADFNYSGFRRSILASPFQRTTTPDRFFCSEAILYAMQKTVLPKIVGADAPICRLNPGSATPSILYEVLTPYATAVQNTIHGFHVPDAEGAAACFVAGSDDV